MTNDPQAENNSGHRKMDDALEKTTRKLQAIFDATVDGMLILDDHFCYSDANPAACRIFARTREEILGEEFGAFSQDQEGTRKSLDR